MLESEYKAQIIPDCDFSYFPNCRIGKGGIGEVYKGINIKDKTIIAVKVVEKQFIINKDLQSKMNRAEEFYNKQLRHENIVNCYGCFQDKTNYYFVQEFCDDGNLKSYLEMKIKSSQRINEIEALTILKDMLNGYLFLRNDGMKVHRDIKPDNIMIKAGRFKINDYDGIKYEIKSNDLASIPLGSPNYQSPEALVDEGINEKTDMWAFGIIFYELLFLDRPFQKTHPCALLDEINERYEEFENKLTKCDFISNQSKELISRMLIRDPNLRLGFEDLIKKYQGLFCGKLCPTKKPNKLDNTRGEEQKLLPPTENKIPVYKKQSKIYNLYLPSLKNELPPMHPLSTTNNTTRTPPAFSGPRSLSPNIPNIKIISVTHIQHRSNSTAKTNNTTNNNTSNNSKTSAIPILENDEKLLSQSQLNTDRSQLSDPVTEFKEIERKNAILKRIRQKVQNYLTFFVCMLNKVEHLGEFTSNGYLTQAELICLSFLFTRIIMSKYQAILSIIKKKRIPLVINDKEWLEIIEINDVSSILELLESSVIIPKLISEYNAYIELLKAQYLQTSRTFFDPLEKKIKIVLEAPFDELHIKLAYDCLIEFIKRKQSLNANIISYRLATPFKEMLELIDKFNGASFLQKKQNIAYNALSQKKKNFFQ